MIDVSADDLTTEKSCTFTAMARARVAGLLEHNAASVAVSVVLLLFDREASECRVK